MNIEIKNRFNDKIIIVGEYVSIKEALEKNCGSDLHGSDLRGADLCGADLHGSDLQRHVFGLAGGNHTSDHGAPGLRRPRLVVRTVLQQLQPDVRGILQDRRGRQGLRPRRHEIGGGQTAIRTEARDSRGRKACSHGKKRLGGGGGIAGRAGGGLQRGCG